ncbi:MAG TPA: alpha/beta fold hydrolase [Vicinamibacteria bacterium]|nr:alpha/beta fold hydrolase [Vicinamibacteria bacterium]
MAVQSDETTFPSRDGLRLHLTRWRPAAPRAALLLLHGLAEHAGRYRHVAERFAGRGHAVDVPELRGHGRSPGPRVHVDRFDDFVDDADAARDRLAAERPGLPLFVIGHSQGGLVALRAALRRPSGLAGVMASSPLLGTHPSMRPGPLLAAAARVLDVVLPAVLLPNHVDPGVLSRDPAVGRAYASDPLVSRRVSPRWYFETLRAIADTHARAAELTVPALVMLSGDDRLLDTAAMARWVAAAPAHLVESVRWDGFYHEMFNEPDRERVFARMDDWLERRLSASA